MVPHFHFKPKGALKLVDKGEGVQQLPPWCRAYMGTGEEFPTASLLGPGVLAREPHRILQASGLSCGSTVHIGLLLATSLSAHPSGAQNSLV
jgi:hypothetical protein